MKFLRTLTLFFALLALACNLPILAAPSPAPTVTITAAPTATAAPLPTATVVPLAQRVTIVTSTSSEAGKAPDYTLKAQIPVLQGSEDPRVQKFNSAVASLIQREAEQFRSSLAQLPATPISAGSFFENGYQVVSPPGDVLSLNFGFSVYSDGAAHPYSYTITYTYDLEKGQEISLDQLFLPGSNYLELIASYCKNELSKRDIGFDGFFTTGADPTPENYRNWNITPDSLMITFDPYQVAAYAAGPQVVTIPYGELHGLINPQGPLEQFQSP